MRTVEANTPRRPVVTAALSAMSASQPDVVAGGCQFQVASAAITNTTVEETSEYQVMRSASAPERSARVTSRITTRQRAAPEAETEGNPLRARGKSDGRRNELEPSKQHRDAEHGAHGRHGEHVGAVDEHDFAQHVGAGERGGAEQRRADLRQTAGGVWGRELSQNGAYAVAGRAVRASVAGSSVSEMHNRTY